MSKLDEKEQERWMLEIYEEEIEGLELEVQLDKLMKMAYNLTNKSKMEDGDENDELEEEEENCEEDDIDLDAQDICPKCDSCGCNYCLMLCY